MSQEWKIRHQPGVNGFGSLLEAKKKWNSEGAKLISLANSLSNLSFKQKEMKCILTVSDFESISHPLIINVKNFIEDESKMSLFVDTVFHELLHVLLTDNCLNGAMDLVKKHANDNPVVMAHLHLMSLERAVHEKLKNFEKIADIEGWYNKIGEGYEVAWQTISNQNLYKEFIKDLHNESHWRGANF